MPNPFGSAQMHWKREVKRREIPGKLYETPQAGGAVLDILQFWMWETLDAQ